MSNSPLYEQDFYAWANQQASLLRDGFWPKNKAFPD